MGLPLASGILLFAPSVTYDGSKVRDGWDLLMEGAVDPDDGTTSYQDFGSEISGRTDPLVSARAYLGKISNLRTAEYVDSFQVLDLEGHFYKTLIFLAADSGTSPLDLTVNKSATGITGIKRFPLSGFTESSIKGGSLQSTMGVFPISRRGTKILTEALSAAKFNVLVTNPPSVRYARTGVPASTPAPAAKPRW